MKLTRTHYIIIGVIILLVILYFATKKKTATSTSALTGTGTMAQGEKIINQNQLQSILNDIQSQSASVQEKSILSDLVNKYYNSFGLVNVNSLNKYQQQIAVGYVNDANNKLKQINNTSKITTQGGTGNSVLNKSCNASGGVLGCHGSWGSGLLGFCFHWGCNIS